MPVVWFSFKNLSTITERPKPLSRDMHPCIPLYCSIVQEQVHDATESAHMDGTKVLPSMRQKGLLIQPNWILYGPG